MKEIIADLTYLSSEDGGDGDDLADHGIVQELENALLDYAGKVIRIKITEYRHRGIPNETLSNKSST